MFAVQNDYTPGTTEMMCNIHFLSLHIDYLWYYLQKNVIY